MSNLALQNNPYTHAAGVFLLDGQQTNWDNFILSLFLEPYLIQRGLVSFAADEAPSSKFLAEVAEAADPPTMTHVAIHYRLTERQYNLIINYKAFMDPGTLRDTTIVVGTKSEAHPGALEFYEASALFATPLVPKE